MSEFKFPTEVVELPSKGLIYPKDNILSSGEVEMKYMTAKEEDILSNQAYIQKGIVLDKLLQSLIVDKNIDYNDLIVGDKNALFMAARILGYGKDYPFEYNGMEYTVDLTELNPRPFDENSIVQGVNEFHFTLPSTNTPIKYKMLTGHDEKRIDRELAGLKRLDKLSSAELSTRLKYMITSVGGDDETKTIREFVDNYLLAKDSRALREHMRTTQPDVDMMYILDSGEEVTIPIGLNFFWPDA